MGVNLPQFSTSMLLVDKRRVLVTIYAVLAGNLLGTCSIPSNVPGTVRDPRAWEAFPEHKFMDVKLLELDGLALNLSSQKVG